MKYAIEIFNNTLRDIKCNNLFAKSVFIRSTLLRHFWVSRKICFTRIHSRVIHYFLKQMCQFKNIPPYSHICHVISALRDLCCHFIFPFWSEQENFSNSFNTGNVFCRGERHCCFETFSFYFFL